MTTTNLGRPYDATVSLLSATPFLRLLAEKGPDAVAGRRKTLLALLARHGLSPETLALKDARVPHQVTLETLEYYVWRLGTEAVALRALRAWKLGDHGIGDYLNATSATIGDLLRTVSEFIRLLHDGVQMSLKTVGDVVLFSYELDDDIVSHRWVPEVVLGKVAMEVRCARGGRRDGLPSAIHFAHAATSYEKEYRVVLALPVEFDRGHDALIFPARALEAPLVTADPVLHDILRRQATHMLHTHPRRTTFLERVRDAALDDLATNAADQACVAQRLGVSAATLRRRLEQRHGTRYSNLVDELKREVTTRHLQERELRIDEIARRAGFTHTAPFYRAFQRWYGCTPNEYRSLRGWLR